MSSNECDLGMHHVGFVVDSIANVIESFCESVGASSRSRVWHDPIQRVRVAFVYCAGSASIELVEPVDHTSPVNKFLERGGGLHHICYEVPDIEETLRLATARGLTIVRKPQPAVAFEGRRIAWVRTKEGLLVEYLEAAAK